MHNARLGVGLNCWFLLSPLNRTINQVYYIVENNTLLTQHFDRHNKQNNITGIFRYDVVILFFSNSILNVYIIYIWPNKNYIKPNFYRTTQLCDSAIGSTVHYHKWTFIGHLIFESSIIIEHDFISNFIVMVYYFTIFADVFLLIFAWFRWCIYSSYAVCLIGRII